MHCNIVGSSTAVNFSNAYACSVHTNSIVHGDLAGVHMATYRKYTCRSHPDSLGKRLDLWQHAIPTLVRLSPYIAVQASKLHILSFHYTNVYIYHRSCVWRVCGRYNLNVYRRATFLHLVGVTCKGNPVIGELDSYKYH